MFSSVRREPRLSIDTRRRFIGCERFSRDHAGKDAHVRLVLPFRGFDSSVISKLCAQTWLLLMNEFQR